MHDAGRFIFSRSLPLLIGKADLFDTLKPDLKMTRLNNRHQSVYADYGYK